MSEKSFLQDIKVGDRVWVGSYNHPRSSGIKEVSHLTPTRILLEGGRHSWEKFHRVGGKYFSEGSQVGRAFMSDRISGIATPEECAAYDTDVAKQAAQRKASKEAEEARETRRNQLRVLFDCGKVNLSRPMFASDIEDGKWDVTFYGLDDNAVRELAQRVGRETK